MKKLLCMSLLLLLAVVLLTACGGEENEYEGMVKVTYELEGGTYRNSADPVVQYYGFESGTENKIKEPSELTEKKVERAGYTLEGWYTDKNGAGTKWDFDSSKVTDAGVTLYANWKKNINYTFELYYKTADGTDVELERGIVVDEGQPVTSAFVSLAESTLTFKGLTSLGEWTDASGNVWDINRDVHPGGETDTCVRLYVKYIEGVYTIVRNLKDFKSAAKMGSNIYLMSDIDFAGGEFEGFGNFGGIIRGNGHKVSNFKLTYASDRNSIQPDTNLDDTGSNLLKISLFGVMNGATVRDITFENYVTEVTLGAMFGSTKILVAPFAMSMSGCTIENVSVTATYTVGKLPSGFDRTDILVATDKVAYYIPTGDTSTVTNATVSMTPAPAAE